MIKEYKGSDVVMMYDSAQNAATRASGVLAFVLNHNISLMRKIYEDTIAKRDEIIRKYADKVDAYGRSSISDPEKLAEANKEFSDYTDIMYSLDIIVIPETKLSDSALTDADMKALSWMIKISSSDDIRALLGIIDEEAEEEKRNQEEIKRKEALKYDPKDPVTDDRFV